MNQTRALNLARKAAIAYNPSFLSTPATFPSPAQNMVAIAKPPMLALLTNNGSNSPAQPTWKVPGSVTGYKPGVLLVEVVGCYRVHADADGGVTAQSNAGAPMVRAPPPFPLARRG
jgi:alpha-amylase